MTVMTIAILVIGILVLFVAVVDFADTHRLVTRHYTLETEKLSRDVTICLISDLHEAECGKDNIRLITAVQEAKPDLVISAGDLVTAHGRREDVSTKEALHLTEVLAKDFPLYAAHGNHEWKLERDAEETYGDLLQRFEEALRDRGVVLLRDEKKAAKAEGLEICGLEIPIDVIKKEPGAVFTVDDIRMRLGEPDPGRFTLLIAHDPAQFEAYVAWGADLVLSGHVHGGIVRLPLIGGLVAPPFELFPRYDAGLFAGNGPSHVTRMIISAGLGEHTLPLRFNNPRELVVIRLKGTGSGTGSKTAGV
ncbi:MAG: metallophosphoesterase [Lachnospiraceae bacterium]|nr:metallophosphoesterase [Lachnospiraceae bacterium]